MGTTDHSSSRFGSDETPSEFLDQSTTVGWSDGDKWLDDAHLLPIKGTREFPPLSLRPIAPGQTMPPVSLADRYTLEKQTPVPPDQDDYVVEKDWNTLVPESEKMINSEVQRLKHTQAISKELTLLLENEKKILNQLTKRCNKFTQLKEENKRKTEQWHSENQKRLAKYESNLAKLANFPDDLSIDLDMDGIHSQIQQKILLEIVHKTAEAASDISVQLSIEETIINDVEMSLTGLKKDSAVMLRQIAEWTKSLSTNDRAEAEMMERWEMIREGLEEFNEVTKQQDEPGKPPRTRSEKWYEYRVRKNEEIIKKGI